MEFIFTYADGGEINVIYDPINNVAEYSEEGYEHYKQLSFYQVDEFSYNNYEEIDEGLMEDKRVFLTRLNLPRKIEGIGRDRQRKTIFINEMKF